MEQHSYRTKIFSAILSVLMATQVFPFAVLADSVVIDSGGVTDPFPDYVPDAVYDDGETLSTVIPPDFTYLTESEYELIRFSEADESESSETETNAPSSEGEPADFNAQLLIRNNKFLSENSKETISILGGSLEYSSTDYVLQGINGLDLVIGRRYKSLSAYEHTADTESLGMVTGIKFIPECYNEQLHDIGKGWCFNFPSIRIGDKTENEGDTLYLDDGNTYAISVKNDGTLKLYAHYTEDFVLEYSDKYSNGAVSSKWVLKYKDGIQKFFSDDGKLIGIENRYGNKINFVNSTKNGHPYVEITDTLGRLTVISGEDIEGGHITKVNLPDNIELKYVVKETDKSYSALTEYYDPMNNVIDYSYNICDATVTLSGRPPQNKTTSCCLLSFLKLILIYE